MGDECAQRHTFHFQPASENQYQAGRDVHYVLGDGYQHRDSGVLHPHKPARQSVEAQHGRCAIDADAEVAGGRQGDLFGGADDEEGSLSDRLLQHDEAQGYYPADAYGPYQQAYRFGQVSAAPCLGRHATGAHAQESKHPIDDIEQHTAHGNGTDVGGCAQVSHDGYVYQPQQRDGDVRYNRG